MLRKNKKYKKPKKKFNKVKIKEENQILKKYGLKNKKELWKAKAKIDKIRKKAKKLIIAGQEEKKEFLEKLNKLGIKVGEIADVLALNEEDWLKRRLQTLLVTKKMARTAKQARQLITHKHVLVDGKVVNVPSYVVPANEEDKIKLKISIKPKNVEKK